MSSSDAAASEARLPNVFVSDNAMQDMEEYASKNMTLAAASTQSRSRSRAKGGEGREGAKGGEREFGADEGEKSNSILSPSPSNQALSRSRSRSPNPLRAEQQHDTATISPSSSVITTPHADNNTSIPRTTSSPATLLSARITPPPRPVSAGADSADPSTPAFSAAAAAGTTTFISTGVKLTRGNSLPVTPTRHYKKNRHNRHRRQHSGPDLSFLVRDRLHVEHAAGADLTKRRLSGGLGSSNLHSQSLLDLSRSTESLHELVAQPMTPKGRRRSKKLDPLDNAVLYADPETDAAGINPALRDELRSVSLTSLTLADDRVTAYGVLPDVGGGGKLSRSGSGRQRSNSLDGDDSPLSLENRLPVIAPIGGSSGDGGGGGGGGLDNSGNSGAVRRHSNLYKETSASELEQQQRSASSTRSPSPIL